MHVHAATLDHQAGIANDVTRFAYSSMKRTARRLTAVTDLGIALKTALLLMTFTVHERCTVEL
jgi:hypothetical protein